jgi:micrococcal nuclease
MHEYKVRIVKVVDGDTVDVDIDLGFGIWLHNERVRIMGIDTPESRTSDKVEKVFGLAAKERLNSLLGDEAILDTQVSKKGEDMKGKFGRILGNFRNINGEHCAKVLIAEGHAVAYDGGSKDDIQEQHLRNRRVLVAQGKIILPPGMTATKPPLVTKPHTPDANDPPIQKANPFESVTQGVVTEYDEKLEAKLHKLVAESDDVTGKKTKKSTDAIDEKIAKATDGEATARADEKPVPTPEPEPTSNQKWAKAKKEKAAANNKK